jgi:DNA repair exonuclease SbcCD nuclease subunit
MNMKTLRLLHTADWQLGRQYTRFAPADCAELYAARFKVLARLAELCVQHKVDAVLVAGDVFDAQDIGDTALRRGFLALASFPCPVVLLPGNHDADVVGGIFERAAELGLMPSQVILAREMAPIFLCDGQLLVLPAPLKRRQEGDLDLVHWAEFASAPGVFRVGLAHGAVRGVLPAEYVRHNLIAPECIEQARLDYLALGDWHGVFRVSARAYYSGTPEPDRFRANDAGFALLVTLNHGALPEIVQLATARFQWRAIRLNFDALLGLSPLRALDDLTASDVLRLELVGKIGLHDERELRRQIAVLRARVAAMDVKDAELMLAPTDVELTAFVSAANAAGGVLSALVQRLVAELRAAESEASSVSADALKLVFDFESLTIENSSSGQPVGGGAVGSGKVGGGFA